MEYSYKIVCYLDVVDYITIKEGSTQRTVISNGNSKDNVLTDRVNSAVLGEDN